MATSQSCKIRLVTLVFLVVFAARIPEARAADVRFSAAGPELSGAALTQMGHLLGFVGDVVELPNGQHQVSIAAREDYEIILMLNVVGRHVEIQHATTRPGNCKPELNVDWSPPEVRESSRSNKIANLVLPELKFGEPTGRTPYCSLPSLAHCSPRKIILHATSTPEGAEIWIDRKMQEYRTNTTLSVPYCTYETQKDILLRFPERVNCLHKIDLAPDARIELKCLLREASAESIIDSGPRVEDDGSADPGAIIVPIPAESDEE